MLDIHCKVIYFAVAVKTEYSSYAYVACGGGGVIKRVSFFARSLARVTRLIVPALKRFLPRGREAGMEWDEMVGADLGRRSRRKGREGVV